MRPLRVVDLGRMRYADALQVQHDLVEQRKRGDGCDTLFYVEHPHVITIGRNGKLHNLLASEEVLARTGIEFHETNRGGDVTYHGPGQLVGYPVVDLREWRRDVHAFFHGVEQVLIDALSDLGVHGERDVRRGFEGVWVGDAKIAAIGIHISRWISSHGFALNLDTDLNFFKYIVPCGLTKPVCSLQSLGLSTAREAAMAAVTRAFESVFQYSAACGKEFQVPAAKTFQETR